MLTEKFLPHLVHGNGRVVTLFSPHYKQSAHMDDPIKAISERDPGDGLGASHVHLLSYMLYCQTAHMDRGVHFVLACAGLVSQLPKVRRHRHRCRASHRSDAPARQLDDVAAVELNTAVDLLKHACEVKLSGEAEHNHMLEGQERFAPIPYEAEDQSHPRAREEAEAVFADAVARTGFPRDALAAEDGEDGSLFDWFSCCGGDRK